MLVLDWLGNYTPTIILRFIFLYVYLNFGLVFNDQNILKIS